ncbi:MAG: hypothetical protein MZV70_38785 [Desulfobacterales bacterium]|nr:hypothetical protein [Desulfobacterales bacterium]
MLYLPPSKQKQHEKALQAFVECKARWEKLENPPLLNVLSFQKTGLYSSMACCQLCGKRSTLSCPSMCSIWPHHHHTRKHTTMSSIYFEKQNVRFIQQTNDHSFKQDLMEILFSLTCDMLFFLVDDILFTEPVDLE